MSLVLDGVGNGESNAIDVSPGIYLLKVSGTFDGGSVDVEFTDLDDETDFVTLRDFDGNDVSMSGAGTRTLIVTQGTVRISTSGGGASMSIRAWLGYVDRFRM